MASAADATAHRNKHHCCVHGDGGAPARRCLAAASYSCNRMDSSSPAVAAAAATPDVGRRHPAAACAVAPPGSAEAAPATVGRVGRKEESARGCPPTRNTSPPQEVPSLKPSRTFGRTEPPGAVLPSASTVGSSGGLGALGVKPADEVRIRAPPSAVPGTTTAVSADPRVDAFLAKVAAASQASSSTSLYQSPLGGSICSASTGVGCAEAENSLFASTSLYQSALGGSICCDSTGVGCAEAEDNLFTSKSNAGTSSIAGGMPVSSTAGDRTSECGKRGGVYRGSVGSDVSDESSFSGSGSGSASVNKPHKANDTRWEAIRAVRSRDGFLGTDHFRLLKKLGCGDIGTVYLAELRGTRSYFAVKTMDREVLASRKKLPRAQTEKEILQCLDHPFLPTLYTHFETEKFSYLVMEFCPGGDLHTLRQRQPGKYFTEHAARFYMAEVLLALEYLHMLGIIYRDLKPENVLVREDGHIMLSDFDLSLRCVVCPTLVKSIKTDIDSPKKSGHCVQPSCVEPSCAIQASCIQPACFAPHFFTSRAKKVRKPKRRDDVGNQVIPLPELIAEPTNARSMSFVGTHEYLAPEIVKGEGHGSAVDWWTFGIFLYELLFGRTPFKGSGNRATLFNVVGEPLRFPESPIVSFAARDLIRGLLVKEPQHRLAHRRGATEVKQHPFFQSVNWALIRCATPPEVPRPFENILDVKASDKYLDMNFF